MDNMENKEVVEVVEETTTPVAETPVVEAPVVETPTVVDNGKNWSIAALVLGILGIVGGAIPVICYFTTVCAILGIIFGVKGRKMSVVAEGKSSGLATAGLVLGIIGTAFAVLGLICTAVCSAALCAAGTAA